MNPGEVWRFEDGTYRVVLSHPTYNTSALDRVISAVVAAPQDGFDPFAVTIAAPLGPGLRAYADRLAMHPATGLSSTSATSEKVHSRRYGGTSPS
ncbi:MAG: hypothetical protein ACRDT6_21090 [Micromonosporaceae bacterium]